MTCFSPLDAWRADSGEIRFFDRGDGRHLTLPCGQCVGCRLERSRQWAIRCVHEASLHDKNVFVTLTYRPEVCPVSLDYRDFQKFMKRARKALGPMRFFMCGEYGERTWRPHFHAVLFGVDFPDAYNWRVGSAGFQLSRSPTLERLWPYGHAEVGNVSFESAAYVARYCVKKVTGAAAVDYYTRPDWRTGECVAVRPEFARMSLRPGIGSDWIRLYRTDVYRGDGDAYVVVNGQKCKPPRYYDQYMSESLEYDEFGAKRLADSLLRRDDNTPERLEVRRQVTEARLRFKKRSLE